MPLSLITRSIVAMAALVMCASPAYSWRERSGPRPNVRPIVETGYDIPEWFQGYRRGAGLGFGFEIEETQAVSVLFRVQWRRIWRTDDVPYYAYPWPEFYYGSRDRSLSMLQWGVGLRGYLRPRATWRPYGEVTMGLRMAEQIEELEGMFISSRVGLAWARHEGSGMMLDGGLELSAEDPNHFVIVPIRVAVAFP